MRDFPPRHPKFRKYVISEFPSSLFRASLESALRLVDRQTSGGVSGAVSGQAALASALFLSPQAAPQRLQVKPDAFLLSSGLCIPVISRIIQLPAPFIPLASCSCISASWRHIRRPSAA